MQNPTDVKPGVTLRIPKRPEWHNGSGRPELAAAIIDPKNPLTARVFVNRLWMHHFGEPLVASTTDFGVRSEPPSHPQLLDWLASEFIRSGWSVKHLHRTILLSSAYQQASIAPKKSEFHHRPTLARADDDTKLLAHFPRRRLDFEAMRDSLLFISGRLDLTMGGRPVDVGAPLSQRRTVYGLVDRQDLPALFRAFDFPIPDQCIERRPRTTVPQQALFALNSPFVMEQARALAVLPEIVAAEKPAQRVDALFRRVLARKPTKSETIKALAFIDATQTDLPVEHGLTPWQQFAQVLLICNEALFID